ncbi:hypothetical protein RB594_006439 [Gaeumannomyces avenae]
MQPDESVLTGDTENTSSIPPDEHAKMLEGHGIRTLFERSQAPSAPSHPGGTQPGATAGTVPSQAQDMQDRPIHGQVHHGPHVRIIVTTSTREVTVRLDPLGHTGPAEAPPRHANVDVAGGGGTDSPGGPSYQKLSVTQSKRDMGMAIQARSYNDDTMLLLNCDLFFDPVADRIAIRNKDSAPVKLHLAVQAGGDGCEQALPRAREIEINRGQIELLDAGDWEVLTGPGVHVLDFSILPRRHVEIVKGPPQPGPKRVRAIEDEDEDEPNVLPRCRFSGPSRLAVSTSLGDKRFRANGHMCNLEKADAARVLYDISSALGYIHSQGIVHNDIKPGNILYSPPNRHDRGAVLIDFGLASETNGKHLNTGGTPWYVPPEFMATEEEEEGKAQTRGRPGDVFALGVVMLFLRRKLPFPELCKDHPQWQIAKVVMVKGREATERASGAMRNWLGYVERSSEKLKHSCALDRIVGLMVQMAVEERIEVEAVCDAAASIWAAVA